MIKYPWVERILLAFNEMTGKSMIYTFIKIVIVRTDRQARLSILAFPASSGYSLKKALKSS